MTTIKLTSDGYSYHTMELKIHPESNEYEEVLSQFYHASVGSKDGTTYPLSKYQSKHTKIHCSTLLCPHGILLYFTKTKGKGCTIKAVVNPRKVLSPKSDYLGIMPNDSSSLESFQDRFTLLMREYHLPESLGDWKLSRLDLCVNLLCGKKKSAEEVCRLLHKAMIPEDMEREYFLDKTAPSEIRKQQKNKDKHSIKLSNKSYSLTVYDKLYQAESEGLSLPMDTKYNGILRVELQCKKNYLKKVAKKHSLEKTSDLLYYMGIHSRDIMLKHIRRIFPGEEHCKPAIALNMIQNSNYQEETRRQLEWLSQRLRYRYTRKSLQAKAKKLFSISPRTLGKRFDQLQQLGINPTPLRSDFYLDRLPSLPLILECLEDDGCRIKINSDGSIEY